MKGCTWLVGGDPKEILSMDTFGGYKTEVNVLTGIREMLALRNKIKNDEHFQRYGGLSEGIGIKTYSHGPMNSAKTPKLQFRVGDLDLPERRNRYISSRE